MSVDDAESSISSSGHQRILRAQVGRKGPDSPGRKMAFILLGFAIAGGAAWLANLTGHASLGPVRLSLSGARSTFFFAATGLVIIGVVQLIKRRRSTPSSPIDGGSTKPSATHMVRSAVLVPNLLLVLLGLGMAGAGVAVITRNVWVGLLLVAVGLGGPSFQGAYRLWASSRSEGT